MLLDVIQFFGDDLTKRQREGCTVAFIEVMSIRHIRVNPEEGDAKAILSVDGMGYQFETLAAATKAARRLADLQSEAMEAHYQERMNQTGHTMKKVLEPLLEQEQGR